MPHAKQKNEPVVEGPTTGGATTPQNGAIVQDVVQERAAQGAAQNGVQSGAQNGVQDTIVEKLQRWKELSLKHLTNEKAWNCTELLVAKNPLGNGRATLQICVNKALTQNAILKFYVSSPLSATYIKSIDQFEALVQFAKKVIAVADKLREIVAWAQGSNIAPENVESIDLDLKI